MLETKKLSFQYPRSEVIFYPDINCQDGSSLLILGNSGVGKSTLLHLLGGLLLPTAGDVIIDDTNIYKLNNRERDHFRGSNIGIVFQKPHFMQSLTVGENLSITRMLAGLKKDEKRSKNVLDRLAILHKWKKKTNELSQGELQRLSIARALVTEPKIVLADEPTSALDDDNCQRVISLLKEVVEYDNASLIIVTHDQRISQSFEEKLFLTHKNKTI